ncbi:hypothetical protein CEP53_010366 [Fusarium sp. AF-6]|nr:hypothetical protein CEP53_010366 [Fusarium sp. AF-6]
MSDTPALTSEVNEIHSLTSDGVNKDMVSRVTCCSAVIASLGIDRGGEICTTDCQGGGKGRNSMWCRIALDDSNIPFCAGPGSGNAQDLYADVVAVIEDGNAG